MNADRSPAGPTAPPGRRIAPPGPSQPALPQGAHCHIWLLEQLDTTRYGLELLDDVERRRAAAFVKPADRLLYLTAHIGTRLILGRYARCHPGALRFDRSCGRCDAPHGKPRLVSPDVPIHFSFSHSGDLVLLAVAAFPVGADVQIIDNQVAVTALAETVLAAPEMATLRTLSDRLRHHAFFMTWARKEAVLKATGDGLRVPMNDLVVSAEAWRPALTAWHDRETVPRMQLCDVDVGDDGYVGAVAGMTDQSMLIELYRLRD